MAGRKPRPTPVLVVDTTYGVVGLRSRGKRKVTANGGLVVVSATAGPAHIPDDLIPSEIHWCEQYEGRLAREWREQIIETLIERMEQ